MCASKKKKREKETQQKEKHQTTNKKDATTDHGKTRYDNQVCYGPMRPTYRIHRYTYVDEKTKYVAKEGAKGQHRTQKRTTNRHARQKARPQTQTTTIYPPYLFLHRPRPPRDTRKKKNPQKRKRYGAATDKGETMKRRTSEAHQPRGNNGMASKYVNNTREGAKGTDHAHTHTHKQDRKEREDGDKSKEKQGMNPTPPRPQTHTRSRYRE